MAGISSPNNAIELLENYFFVGFYRLLFVVIYTYDAEIYFVYSPDDMAASFSWMISSYNMSWSLRVWSTGSGDLENILKNLKTHQHKYNITIYN